LKIPSDLSGVHTLKFRWPREDGNHHAAVGTACDSIRKVIRDLGVAETKMNKQLVDIQSRQETTETRIRTLQVLVKGLITEFELDKLVGLAREGAFTVRFHNDMIEELERLDALRYLEPQPNYGIVSIRERDGRGDEFDLKQYVRITSEGMEYLKMRDDLLHQNMPKTG
jgi:hypothetical protein